MSDASKKVTRFKSPTSIGYTIRSGAASGGFLRSIKEGKIVGMRCPETRKVYVPPRGPSPTSGLLMTEEVEVSDRGIITTFCEVNVPFEGQALEIPYVAASILLDGADIPMLHLIGECTPTEIRMGMRVKAIWKDESEWGHTTENILYFVPTGENDAALSDFVEHL
ncbi:MAG: Zn-ribbon domain-containing OB-fold protein [Myxococcota bacterium]|nr:Zn-ribbon domain-containing OB-fold protein [Myxococcota bacterium]